MTQAITRGMRSTVAGNGTSRILFWGAGLAISALVGASLYAAAANTVEDDARKRFGGIARGAQMALTARLTTYRELVRGMSALFRSSEAPVTRLQFHRYAEALDFERQFPAIEAVSFAAAVPDAGRDAFVAAVRADRSVAPGGHPEFSIKPPGRRPHYEVLTYIEPLTGAASEKFGVDMANKPAVARALDRARDTGELSSSGVPVQVDGPHPHLGMGMRLPVYRFGAPLASVAERRAAYLGSVGVGFSVPALGQGTLDQLAVPGLQLALFSSASGTAPLPQGADRLLFSAGALPSSRFEQARYFRTVLPVDFNGIPWKAQLSIRKTDLYNRFDHLFPYAALAVGFAGSMLLYAYFLALYWSRRSAVAQNALLDSVLDSVDAHVYMKDRERRYTYVNARTAEAMGRAPHEVIGKRDREVLPVETADAYWEQDRKVFEKGERQAGQVEFVQLDGQARQFWTVKVPVMLDGKASAVIGLATDVTELHELKAQADAASQAKSNFLSNMSHEIRTPMNSIIGMSHLALKSATSPKQRDYLEKIHHSSQHLLGIINDILDFSKIEAGKLDLEVVDFALGTLMENIAHQLGQAAANKHLALEFEIAPGLSHQLRGDPLRLEQVLLNFASNAIKFSENGVVRISATPMQESDNDTVVRFEVRDNGIGMTAAEVGELFKSFHQADPSTTRKYGGTGLGLVISKQLAELMGGSVGVDSVPGKGSTFWFSARLGKGVSFMRAGPEPVPQAVLDEIAGACILLVEDNVFSQQVGQELLEEARATVVVAGNGKEAIDLMLRRRFDCVLMDLQMPVMDGFEATRMIRSDPRLRDAVVIAMTANAGRNDQAHCIEAGMDEFITKPASPKLLFEVIAHWLRKRPLRAADLAPAPEAAPEDAGGMLDLAALALTFGGNPDKMRKYAFMFLDSARDALAAIGDALDRGELERAADIGHRVKSSARAVGAMDFALVCQQLEQLRAGGAAADAHALLARMAILHQQLAQHMSAELDAPADS